MSARDLPMHDAAAAHVDGDRPMDDAAAAHVDGDLLAAAAASGGSGGGGGAAAAAEAKKPAKKKKKKKPTGLSVNYDRAEKIFRITWWAFANVVRPWVLGECRGWCDKFHAEEEWYRRQKTDPPVDPTEKDKAADEKRHLILLCKHVPGFRTFWLEIETDLRTMVEPFWEWEKGNFKPLFHSIIQVASLFAFYERPTLTKTAVVTLWLLYYYSNLEDRNGRPDLLVLIAANCWAMNERVVELHHARQSRGMKWTRDLDLTDFKHFSCLTSFRSKMLARRDTANTTARKDTVPRIKSLHIAIEKGKKNKGTRDVTVKFLKESFVKAAKGGFSRWKNEPVKCDVGLQRLLEDDHFPHACSLIAVERWIQKAAEDFDPLVRKHLKAELQQMCEERGLAWKKQTLLKPQLAQMLRDNGYEDPDSSDPDDAE